MGYNSVSGTIRYQSGSKFEMFLNVLRERDFKRSERLKAKNQEDL